MTPTVDFEMLLTGITDEINMLAREEGQIEVTWPITRQEFARVIHGARGRWYYKHKQAWERVEELEGQLAEVKVHNGLKPIDVAHEDIKAVASAARALRRTKPISFGDMRPGVCTVCGSTIPFEADPICEQLEDLARRIRAAVMRTCGECAHHSEQANACGAPLPHCLASYTRLTRFATTRVENCPCFAAKEAEM